MNGLVLALLVVCGVSLLAAFAALGRDRSATRSGGALTDPIRRGSSMPTAGVILGAVGMAVDDDPNAEQLPTPPARRPFGFGVMLGISLVSGATALLMALILWLSD